MTYAEILISIMTRRDDVICLTAEARVALGDIPTTFPDRFFDFGIAEMNECGAAVGMAALGLLPIVHVPSAVFLTMRAFETIRTIVAMQGFNVKFPGFLPGVSIGFQGPTHYPLEDIALMRGIPGMGVMAAASQQELREVVHRAVEIDGCVYFRVPMVLPEKLEYCQPAGPIDQPRMMCQGDRGLVLSFGGRVPDTLVACKKLNLSLANVIVLDPLPVEALVALMKDHQKVAVVEEHFITGGLGTMVAEVIADAGLKKQLLRIGINDEFPDCTAQYEDNLKYVGLDSDGIAAKLGEFFS